MSAMASQIPGVSTVCSAVCSGADQREPFDDVIEVYRLPNYRFPLHAVYSTALYINSPIRYSFFHNDIRIKYVRPANILIEETT